MAEAQALATILIVEGDREAAALAVFHLVREGHRLRAVEGAARLPEEISRERPDLLLLAQPVLQAGTPHNGAHPLASVRRLRAHPDGRDLPIIVLAGGGAPADRVQALEAGADDVLVRPLLPRELVLRVERLLRLVRGSGAAASRSLRVNDLALHPDRLLLEHAGRTFDLTPTECRLLQELMHRPGVVRHRQELVQAVWGETRRIRARSIDMHIKRLRTKLGTSRDHIETIRGWGYRVQ